MLLLVIFTILSSASASDPDDPHFTLNFFMHDILGGSNPTARAVTGVVNNPALSGTLPFAKMGLSYPSTMGYPKTMATLALSTTTTFHSSLALVEPHPQWYKTMLTMVGGLETYLSSVVNDCD